jgi:dihydrofolate reductase
MGQLIYSALCSLDGFTTDREGKFDWAFPDPELHRAVNALEAGIGTCLYGRRMYETMVFWETASQKVDLAPEEAEYERLWLASEKVVFSSTLTGVSSERTRLERTFDPETVRRWKAAAPRDLSIGGPGLAATALGAGLVDQVHLFLFPITVGGGTRVWPQDVTVNLQLVSERRFSAGVVHLHYAVKS